MISVIIAAKDCEKWIQRTVQSLLEQEFHDWECLISVNGSSDRTEEIARSFDDRRFRVITSDIPNKSLAVNRALVNSSRDLICILDADDLWHPTKLGKQYLSIIDSKIDILGTQMVYIDENENEIMNTPHLPTDHDSCVSSLMKRENPIANSSVMYRKSLHDKVGYYDPEMFAVEDYDIWMRSMRAGLRFSNLKEKLLFHRLHGQSHYNSTNKQQICKHLVDEINFFFERNK